MGYSDIYLDFLSGRETAREFYASQSLEEVAAALDDIAYDRERIVVVLKRQNRLFGASRETFANIEKLKDGKTLCVFAGQQACLFGGPLLVVIKAVAVVKAARLYSERLNRPVVPVFWIAGDDHDFEEVNHTWLLDRQAELVKLSYPTPPPKELPVSEITFTDAAALEQAKASLKEVLGNTDFTSALYELLERSYTTDDTFVTAFGKFLTGLTGELGLILFSPGDAEIKEHARPFFRSILDSQDELHTVIAATNQRLKEHGYHIQVEKKDNVSHLFCNCDGRKPVMREGDDFAVGDMRYTGQQLRDCLERHPERFSPDVMLRPVLQSYLFPVLSQKGGPAEIAYLAQINPLFRLFDLVPPYYMARPSATFIEKRFSRMMAEYGITFEDLTGDIEQVINRVLAKTFPENLEKNLERLRRDVELRFEDFVEESLQFDPSLRDFAKQTFGRIDYTLKQFENKVFASHKKKSKQTREKIYRLWRTLYPQRALQERTLNVSYFLARYGLDFIRFMYDTIDCEQKAHQLVSLTELTT
jgi:bacillithiol biosynthesis cysteine-adding enzyme BshC